MFIPCSRLLHITMKLLVEDWHYNLEEQQQPLEEFQFAIMASEQAISLTSTFSAATCVTQSENLANSMSFTQNGFQSMSLPCRRLLRFTMKLLVEDRHSTTSTRKTQSENYQVPWALHKMDSIIFTYLVVAFCILMMIMQLLLMKIGIEHFW